MSMRGFTLIETLVAISILMIAMTGPILTAERAYIASLIARDQLTASFLSQEGIEYIRAMRDDEYLHYYALSVPNPSTSGWADFLTGGSNSSSVAQCRNGAQCLLDPTNPMGVGTVGNTGVGAIEPCVGPACTALNISGGIYTQRSGTATSFKRKITISDVSATEVTVTVVVSWLTNHTTYQVTTTDHLTPWQ